MFTGCDFPSDETGIVRSHHARVDNTLGAYVLGCFERGAVALNAGFHWWSNENNHNDEVAEFLIYKRGSE